MNFRMIHENYNVADLEKSLAFYEKALGLTEKRRITAEDGAFVIVYVALSFIPWAVIIPGVASVIMYSALFWVFADYIGNQVVRIIVKVIIAAIFVLMEIAIFANATVPWLEGREANKPRIRVEKG